MHQMFSGFDSPVENRKGNFLACFPQRRGEEDERGWSVNSNGRTIVKGILGGAPRVCGMHNKSEKSCIQ
jgi:hypothetical protein